MKENDENIEIVSNMKDAIQYNMDLESKRKKLHLKSDHALCGAVVLNTKTNLSLNRASELLYVDYDDAVKEKANLSKIEKPSTSKAKKFLEIINK
ncbi:MAG: hypothetical protein BZ136_04190 [Methanosphaera sp. rholeuAM74]|nr:MAG: hypothetical protein BZ136_04190 [Methanosphaera sp. rholeuAM74]